ncbi:hypothetical protein ACP70R_018774 [Stipagrostis hirtigluma subsp. patula]
MKLTGTHLTQASLSVHLLKVEGISHFVAMTRPSRIRQKKCYYNTVHVGYRCEVDGYEWETRFYPVYARPEHWVALDLVFLGEAGVSNVTATLACRLVDPTGTLAPSEEATSVATKFQRAADCSEPVWIMKTSDVEASGYLKSDSLTVELTVTVYKDLAAIPLPSSDMCQHLGLLLRTHAGSDVTFMVEGESFAAHKIVLAARSPVFMAEFFGEMDERTSHCVKIDEMEAKVFKAMLHFIYTDTVPELDEKDAAMVMAEHLLAAADRYALDRLKVLCERRLAFGIDVGTAATTLALAERYGCSQLKAKCVEFIAGGSPKTLEAVLATKGYKILEESNPTVVTELLRAAHGKKN